MEKEQLLRLAEEFNKKPRLERERINSSLHGIKSDYLQGYEDAVEKACDLLITALNEGLLETSDIGKLNMWLRKAMEN